MVTFAVEPWSEALEETKPLLALHWQEVAADRDHIPLAVDWDRYNAFDTLGLLHCVTARHESAIVGYHWLIVMPHAHYGTTLMAFSDVFYILPKHRRGWTGINLFRFTEDSLRKLGVVKVFLPTKPHIDMGRVFQRLGYRIHETVYSKVIG